MATRKALREENRELRRKLASYEAQIATLVKLQAAHIPRLGELHDRIATEFGREHHMAHYVEDLLRLCAVPAIDC